MPLTTAGQAPARDVLRPLLDRLRGWRHAAGPLADPTFEAPPTPPPDDGAAAHAAAEAAARAAADEDQARADWADRLWGPGFVLPGGEAEVLRLSNLLPLSPANTLLLIGQDAGGAAQAIALHRGPWLVCHQHDPLLAARMAARLRPLGRRAVVQPWDPAAPAFRPRFHNHALSIEALRSGADPAALIRAIADGLKPEGQLVLLETVAEPPPANLATVFRRWQALDGRAGPPPRRNTVERALQSAGFTIHVAEDGGARTSAIATERWSRLIGSLKGDDRLADRAAAATLVTEAEAWLIRHRLLAAGLVTLCRWHVSLSR